MEVASFSEIADEFQARVARIVWCTVSTVDTKGRPRSRILHPIWEGSTGYIATSPNSLKAKHLAKNPYVSLSYWDQQHQQVYADCKAEWIGDAGLGLMNRLRPSLEHRMLEKAGAAIVRAADTKEVRISFGRWFAD